MTSVALTWLWSCPCIHVRGWKKNFRKVISKSMKCNIALKEFNPKCWASSPVASCWLHPVNYSCTLQSRIRPCYLLIRAHRGSAGHLRGSRAALAVTMTREVLLAISHELWTTKLAFEIGFSKFLFLLNILTYTTWVLLNNHVLKQGFHYNHFNFSPFWKISLSEKL